jgi:hypothetical protein
MKDKLFVSIIGHEEDEEDFEGRLLGLVTNKQLGVLLTRTELWKKIITKETVTLCEFMNDYDALEEKRMVVAITERHGSKKDKPVYRRLYISPQIDHVSSVTSSNEITLTCKEDSLIMLREN